MAGLVSYGSSDEEEDEQETVQGEASPLPVTEQTASPPISTANDRQLIVPNETNGTARTSNGPTITSQHTGPQKELDAPTLGPAVGPMMPATSTVSLPSLQEDSDSTPQSPYSANRALIRQLTLPTVPNLDIPASPPQPPPASTNAKFAHFLKLKKQGIHFNEKLAKSSALKNPSLMQKLMDFAEIDESEQFATILPANIWDPKCFPEWAYKEELAKSQQEVSKRKDSEKEIRSAVDFVPATAPGVASQAGTPGGQSDSKQSTTERIPASLEGRQSGKPQAYAGMKRKTRFES